MEYSLDLRFSRDHSVLEPRTDGGCSACFGTYPKACPKTLSALENRFSGSSRVPESKVAGGCIVL